MKVHHIPEEKRFGLLDSTGTAWGELDYTIRGTVLSITHTGVSNEKKRPRPWRFAHGRCN